ncbi:MAG TPA: hypothetical protein VJS64_07570 [Pyrinomonadaceae bacterium]|nr:hypothetical protein [Pyrinomonadaceae bacterium]
MQAMDCRNFTELLDSYFCQELAVETNHAILRHAELCPSCRNEMAARRQLRLTLRRVCSREVMSGEAIDHLRTRLQTEVNPGGKSPRDPSWREWFARIFAPRLVLSAASMAALLLLFGGFWAFYSYRAGVELKRGKIVGSELSSALMDEAAEDHLSCAGKFAFASGSMKMPDSVKEFDSAYLGLEEAAEPGAALAGGLQLRSAHVCNHEGRRFAHLVYVRSAQLISLLVTERDLKALGGTNLPNDDGSQSGLQRALRSRIALGAYQTKKHVVLVVSELPEAENIVLAEQLAAPIAAHLRRLETQNVRMTINLRAGDAQRL